MIRLHFRFLGSSIVGAAIVAACGSSVNTPARLGDPTGSGGDFTSGSYPVSNNASTDVGAGAGSTSTGSGGGAEPPLAGPPNPGDGPGVAFAITKLFLGDTDRNGTPDATSGWKHFGFDVDHKISTKTSVDLCKPAPGASPSDVYPDGDDGIDNSFGSNILPILLGFAPDGSAKINASLAEGKSTQIFHLEGLGAASDYNPLVSKFYDGANLGTIPKLDGTDLWPVAVEDLTNPGDIESAKLVFPTSYLAAGTWVSGQPMGEIVILLNIAGYALPLDIQHAVIAMDLAPDHQSATNGTISGVIATEDLISQFQKVAGSFDEGLCSGSTFNSIATELSQASDILTDGTQDPSKTCDAISIGLGFEAHAVKLGPIAPPVQQMPDPCANPPSP